MAPSSTEPPPQEPTDPTPAMIMIQLIRDLAQTTLAPMMSSITAPPSPSERLVEPVSPEPRANIKNSRADDAYPLPPTAPTRVLSGRHTQFWGHPVFVQSNSPLQHVRIPIYADYDYNNIDVPPPNPPPPPPPNQYLPPGVAHYLPPPGVPVPVPGNYLRPVPVNYLHPVPPNFLPPVPGNQLYVYPYPLPIANPALLYRNADNSHSRVKMHNTDYNQYVYHGADSAQLQVPIQQSVPQPMHQQVVNNVDPRSQKKLVRQTHIGPYFNLEPQGHPVAAQSQIQPRIQTFSKRNALPRQRIAHSRGQQSTYALAQQSHLPPQTQTHVQYFGQKVGSN